MFVRLFIEQSNLCNAEKRLLHIYLLFYFLGVRDSKPIIIYRLRIIFRFDMENGFELNSPDSIRTWRLNGILENNNWIFGVDNILKTLGAGLLFVPC